MVNKLNELLKLTNDCVFNFNITSGLVTIAYCKGKTIVENVEFQEFINAYCLENELLPQAFNQLDFKGLINDKKGELTFEGYKTDNTPVDCDFAWEYFDDENISCIVSFKKSSKNKYDALTNIYNKSSITNIANNISKEVSEFSLVIIDVDNFKTINDSYGHMFGDTVLAKISEILLKLIPGYVGRFGGDEFMAIITGSTQYDRIWNILHSVSLEVEKYSNDNPRNASISLTIGCSRYSIDGFEYEELFLKADKALYRGKRKGKKCFIIYNNEKHKDLDTYYSIENSGKKRDINYANLLVECYKLISSNTNQFTTIKKIVDYLGNYFICDRITLYLKNNENNYPFCYDWCSPINLSETKTLLRIPFNTELWKEHFSSKHYCSMDKIANIEGVNQELYLQLVEENTKSTMVVEIIKEETIYGFLRFDSCTKLRKFTAEEKDTILLISNMLGIYFSRNIDSLDIENSLFFDPLTHLYNYSHFFQLMENRIRNTKSNYTLIGFDMEHFASVNDVFGYEVGDAILKEMASILIENIKDNMILARGIGAHFILLVENYTKDQLIDLFDKITKRVSSIGLNQVNGIATVHFIMAIYNLMPGDTVSKSIEKLKLTYEAAGIGTESRYLIFDNSIENAKAYQNELALHMKDGLFNDEFEIYLQPKIDIHTGEIIGAEALSRWNYKKQSYISPNIYIPIFEKNGFINTFDRYVFEQVCAFIHKCQMYEYKEVPISVNLSKNVDSLHDYIDMLEKTRKDYNVNPSILELEVTETVFHQDVNYVTNALNNLKALGYKISMDDFGSGNSNLDLLSLFDFDVLKIDKIFIDHINDEKQVKILKAVINLAYELNIKVLCEGVETKNQLEALRNLGCNWVQGFYYDKPLSMTNFINKYCLK